MPSNACDENIINPCHDIENVKILHDPSSDIELELSRERGDILIRGFWDRSTDCIVDATMRDVNQSSYSQRKPSSMLKSAESEKKNKCLESCLKQRRHFTPFVFSCEGLMGKEADTFLCRLAKKLS